jgi:hypothetical protein
MKKLVNKLGKWAIVYVAIDSACSVALVVWFFSPWWPL